MVGNNFDNRYQEYNGIDVKKTCEKNYNRLGLIKNKNKTKTKQNKTNLARRGLSN